MATKPSDLLSRLPSANELLEKPPIRALADRWNRSVVAAGVRSFLDELRSDLERRAADVHLPSLRELAERAARHVAVLAAVGPCARRSTRPAASLRPTWSGPPLADDALERIVSLGRGYRARRAGDRPRRRRRDALPTHRRRSGDRRQQLFRRRLAGAGGACRRSGRSSIARRDVGELEAGSSLAIVAAGGRGLAPRSRRRESHVGGRLRSGVDDRNGGHRSAHARPLPRRGRRHEPVELEALGRPGARPRTAACRFARRRAAGGWTAGARARES